MKKNVFLILLLVGIVYSKENKIYLERAKVVGKSFYESGEVSHIIKESFVYRIKEETKYFKNGNIERVKRYYKNIFLADVIYDKYGQKKCKKENVNLDLSLSMTTKALSEGNFKNQSLNVKNRLFEKLTKKDLEKKENHKTKLVCKIDNSFIFMIDYDYYIYKNNIQEIFNKGIKIYIKNPKDVKELNEAQAENLVNRYFRL